MIVEPISIVEALEADGLQVICEADSEQTIRFHLPRSSEVACAPLIRMAEIQRTIRSNFRNDVYKPDISPILEK